MKSIQKQYIMLLACLLMVSFLFGQSNFEFSAKKQKAKIPFDLVSNLMVIPVTVNGVELSFLLDTGVKETILFNVSEIDSLALNQAEFFTVKGANDVEVKALKSRNNTVEIGGVKSENHLVYVAFNQGNNLSSYLGEEINGIIGYHFFKDFVVELLYEHELIKVYQKDFYKKKWKRFTAVDLDFAKGKPFVGVKLGDSLIENFLIDTGMSDGMWMFKEDALSLSHYGYYEDYLGMTVSGEILGKRSKINELEFVGRVFKNVKISYPYHKELPEELKDFSQRAGSIGGDLLKRFTVVFDYNNSKMYVKANKHIDNPFYYNKSGLVLRQDGDAVAKNNNNQLLKSLQDNNFISYVDLSYVLTPEFVIDHVRKNSPAAQAGLLKDDVLLEVNGKKTYQYKLKSITALFHDKDNKQITMKIKRGDVVMEKKFKLKSPLKKSTLVQN